MTQESTSDLGRRLQTYGTGGHSSGAPEAGPNYTGAWRLFAAASGSALALATSGVATTIYSGLQNISATNSAKLINIDGAVFRLNAYAYYGFFGNYRRAFFNGNSAAAGVLTSGGAVKMLASGNIISAGGQFAAGPAALGLFGGDGFAGVQFQTSLNQTHYGWVHLREDSITTTTIIDWAYESAAGQPIAAGFFVPEPSTRALTLLALGSAGVLAWRRRRKVNAA